MCLCDAQAQTQNPLSRSLCFSLFLDSTVSLTRCLSHHLSFPFSSSPNFALSQSLRICLSLRSFKVLTIALRQRATESPFPKTESPSSSSPNFALSVSQNLSLALSLCLCVHTQIRACANTGSNPTAMMSRAFDKPYLGYMAYYDVMYVKIYMYRCMHIYMYVCTYVCDIYMVSRAFDEPYLCWMIWYVMYI